MSRSNKRGRASSRSKKVVSTKTKTEKRNNSQVDLGPAPEPTSSAIAARKRESVTIDPPPCEMQYQTPAAIPNQQPLGELPVLTHVAAQEPTAEQPPVNEPSAELAAEELAAEELVAEELAAEELAAPELAAPEPVALERSIVGCRNCDTLLQTNNLALERLFDEIARLRGDIQDCLANKADSNRESDAESARQSDGAGDPEQVEELLWQIRQRDEQLAAAQREQESLEQQNQELAAKLASQNVRKSVQTSNSSTDDALSWEERKKLILQQMETDSFDTEAFVSDLQSNHKLQSVVPSDDLALDPVSYIEHLCTELERRSNELKSKNEEIGELHCLLEQQGGAREGGLAIGAAAIAQMMDSDEIVNEERERLKQLQAEWEEKFRKGEIEASLERAKLSRERQELARRESELEEQLEHMKRELRLATESSTPGTGNPRRWLQKLGLGESRD